MPSYSRPGVFVNESPLKAVVTNRAGRTTSTFVGQSPRGPIGKPVLIRSWLGFRSVFGDIDPSYELGYSVYQYFSNGGNECYIVRVLTTSAVANTASAFVVTHGASQSLFTATSKLEGVDGDKVSIHITKNSANPDTGSGSTVGGSGIIDLTIKYDGVVEKTFTGLEFDNNTGPESPTIKVNHAVAGSQYITVSAQSFDSNVTGAKIHAAYATEVSHTLAGGATGGTAAKATAYVKGQEEGTTANMFLLTADNTGAWGSNLTVESSAGVETASATTYGTFNLIIKLSGAEVERHSEISIDPTHSRYVLTLLNNYSDYVTVSAVSTATKATDTKVTAGTATLVGGSNGTAVVAADYSAALNYLDQVTGDLVVNLPGRSAAADVNFALAYASNRGTGFVVIDPDPTALTAAAAVTATSAYTKSGYGAVYYPSATVNDPTKTGPAALRTAPLGGAIMAIYGKAERMHSVAKAPAGLSLNLANVFGLVTNYTEANEATLYDAHINPIRLVPGTGAIVNGTRTLIRTTPDKYIPIRRTLNFVKARMKALTAFAVFEPNDVNLRARVISVLERELRGLWSQRGLKGGTSAQAFYVICDATNNSASTIANGELHVEVGLALQYPAEYVVINVSQWTGGSNATDTL